MNVVTTDSSRPRRGLALLALLLTATVPTVGTYSAMVAFPESGLAKGLFMAAKGWLLVAPLLWLRLVERRPIRMPRWSSRGMVAGHASGLLIAAAIVGGYLVVGRRWIDLGPMMGKIEQMTLDRWASYLALAFYASFVNSLLEEYFWRWFVYRRLVEVLGAGAENGGRWPSLGLAVLGSALLFTVHHVIALDAYFDWRVTALGSAGVFVGGVTWSILYARYRNIYAAWVSHVWADLAIFAIGAQLIFG